MEERIILGSTLSGFLLTAGRVWLPLPCPDADPRDPRLVWDQAEGIVPSTMGGVSAFACLLSAFQRVAAKYEGCVGGQRRILGVSSHLF